MNINTGWTWIGQKMNNYTTEEITHIFKQERLQILTTLLLTRV